MLIVLCSKDRVPRFLLCLAPMVDAHSPVRNVLAKVDWRLFLLPWWYHWRLEITLIVDADAHFMYLNGLFFHLIWQIIVVSAKLVEFLRLIGF